MEPETFEKGKLFVGGLSWRTTTSTLQEYFEQFGDWISCCIMVNAKTGKPRGFGFVSFNSDTIVEKLLSENHVIDGKGVEVKPCTPKILNRLIRREKDAVDSRKVFLGGIPHFATEAQLERAFEQHFGQVEEAVIICRPDYSGGTPKSRGFGFVTFDDEKVAQLAVRQKYIFFMGKQVEIKPAERKNPCEFIYPPPPVAPDNYSSFPASSSFPTPPLFGPVHDKPGQLMVQCQPNQLLTHSPPPQSSLVTTSAHSTATPSPPPPMFMFDQNYSYWFQSQTGLMHPLPYQANQIQSGYASYPYIK